VPRAQRRQPRGSTNLRDANPALFDLDGTLTDNSAGIVKSARVGLVSVGVDGVTDSQIRAQIGPPLRAMYTNLGLADDQIEAAVAGYRSYYGDHGVLDNSVYEGIASALTALSESGRTLAVATSKPETFARRILDHFDLAHYFAFIGGATLDGTRETKAAVVSHTLAAVGAEPADALMIGDRRHDIEGARTAGVKRSIGVTWGFGSRNELETAHATTTIDDPAELIALLC